MLLQRITVRDRLWKKYHVNGPITRNEDYHFVRVRFRWLIRLCSSVYTKWTVSKVNVLTFVDAVCDVAKLYVAKDVMGNSAGTRSKIRVVDVERYAFLEFRHCALHGLENVLRADLRYLIVSGTKISDLYYRSKIKRRSLEWVAR